jgi:tRNA pseudouridine65 synthase
VDIIYQDQYLVAVNKPSGLLVHKSWVAKDAKEFALQKVRDLTGQHVFPAHRLDRPTSGVLLFAFSGEIAQQIQASWDSAEKIYWAVVRGWLKDSVTVDHPLKGMDDYGQSSSDYQDATTVFHSKAQIEIDATIDKYPKSRFSWVEALPQQGRTHQIRRHLKHISHPIIGDVRYGKGNYNRYFNDHLGTGRLLLHARELTIIHPITGNPICFVAQLCDDMQQLFDHFHWKTAL